MSNNSNKSKRIFNVNETVGFIYYTRYDTRDSQYGVIKYLHDDYLVIKGEDKISYIVRYKNVEKLQFIKDRQGDENN